MKIKSLFYFVRKNASRTYPVIAVVTLIAGLMLYKLGSLTGGLSSGEVNVAHTAIGWHGIRNNPFYLPLNFVRSVLMVLFNHHGQTVIRLGNTLFGVLAVVTFSRLVQLWYGSRTAALSSILFITSAWMLHVSRVATNDVMYLAALPVLFYVQIGLKKAQKPRWLFFAAVIWGLALYIPGLIWLIGVQVWLLRKEIKQLLTGLKDIKKRVALGLSVVVWLPLLLVYLLSSRSAFITWLGLPEHMPSLSEFAKQLAAVPVHLFVHGPMNPELWLGKAPLLDIFSLVCCVLGIYFYATHLKASRSRSLFSIFGVSWILIALGGPVTLSLLVPLLYLFVACGIGYLLHDWLKVFPRNPLARAFGISLIAIAVAFSSFYNLRAYFIAWPHNRDTISTFTRKL
jgi:4-amino-4-deoxy-L-arabinose transferase-like glycosyltransferase